MQTISIIRGRGQLTIPESIRKVVNWTTSMSAVSISLVKPDEILIKPHRQSLDWNQIWKGVEKSRGLKGEGRTTSAIDFLELDRNSH